MNYQLKQTTTYMTYDEASANQIVDDAKDEGYMIEHSIKEKFHRKSETIWYEVKIVTERFKTTDVLEAGQ